MAKRKYSKASKGEAKERTKESSAREALLLKIRDRYSVMTDADQENRNAGLEDLKFANEPGAQWDANMKKERGNRPCYEFNKCRINGKRVINEIRANRPQMKVRAVENGDKKTAEIYEGLIRNICNTSDFDTVTDQAAEYQVDAGMAAWRITTEYAAEDVFDQDIVIKPFKNPFCVYADPSCQDVLKRDAEDWLITERISKKAYETRWPDAEPIQFEESVEFDDQDDWEDGESVRICEYWYKEPYQKEIWLMPDGKTIDSSKPEAKAYETQGLKPIKKRSVVCQRIKMCIASGDAILEEADWAGSIFPFVMIYGEYKVIDGQVKWWGLHRFAKDAQRSYNTSRTAIDETIALAPQSKWWATAKQAEGLTDKWAVAHKQNLPWLPYNADPAAQNGAPPQRMPGADVPIALLQQAEVAAQDLRDVTGLHEASFGEESGEKSGIALARKQNQAQIVTYNFPDNIAKGVRLTGEILIDLIPHIYDAQRELRIIGADGAEDYVTVNQPVPGPPDAEGMPTTIRQNDLTRGKYDLTVTVGPNFSTLRQEAAEIYPQLFPPDSPIYPFVADLIAKSLDYPYSEEMAERIKLALPAPVQKMLTEGKDLPPEVVQAQAQIDQARAVVQEQTALVQQAAQEVQGEQAKSEKAKAAVDIAIAKLHEAEAKFEANIAKTQADLTKRETMLQAKEMVVSGQQQATEGAAKQITSVEGVAQQLDQYLAQFMQAVGEVMQRIEANSGVTIAMPKKSRLKGVKASRVNGELVAVPEYDGDSDEPRIARVRASRGPDGSLVGVPEYEDQMAAPTAVQ